MAPAPASTPTHDRFGSLSFPSLAAGLRAAIGLHVALAAVPLLSAGTFTVTQTGDSGPGTLRQAILDANASPGADTIAFALPGPGVQTIAPIRILPALTEAALVDGFTQPGSRANSLASGSDAVLLIRLDGVQVTNTYPAGLILGANGVSVRGLTIVRFYTGVYLDSVSGCRVTGMHLGLDVDGIARGGGGDGVTITAAPWAQAKQNLIGGPDPADRNVIGGFSNGIFVFTGTAGDNTLQNNYIGCDASGSLPRGNKFYGILVQAAPDVVIGGSSPGAGNVIDASGQGIVLLAASKAVVRGNIVGGDASGRYALGNQREGIVVQGSRNVILGGRSPGEGNLVVNNGGHGILLLASTGTAVQGNWVGTDAARTRPMGNAGAGVAIQADQNLIGGLQPGAANVIHFNGANGVAVFSGSSNTVRGNLILDNAGLGIDLTPEGVTPNDPGDEDSGANGLQNAPELTAALTASSDATVTGTLASRPGTAYQIDLYSSPLWDPDGHAEGQTWLGTLEATTGPEGTAAFTLSLPAALPLDSVVTATATDPAGNTSEFSPGLKVSPRGQGPFLRLHRVGSACVLTWPSQSGGAALAATRSLQPPVQWEPVTEGIADDGTWKSLTLDPSAAACRFFGLRQ